jgi:release factor glutamine methyltransferase
LNIRDALQHLTSLGVARSEVRLLAAHALQCDPAWLVQHDTDELSATQFEAIRLLIARRVAGEPIAYIVGYREFYGRRFKCTPAALIPRPETELLVEVAKDLIPSLHRGEFLCKHPSSILAEDTNSQDDHHPLPYPSPLKGEGIKLLDIGTGTGCIAITLALECALANVQARVTACDLSRDALALARENTAALGANVRFVESDWFSAFDPKNENDRFDVIVSNPPYIAPNDPHLFRGDLRFEPWLALQDRVDGLESYRELVRGAKTQLREDGVLIVEHGYDQGDSVPELFREAGFVDVEMIRDLAGNARVTRGRFSNAL